LVDSFFTGSALGAGYVAIGLTQTRKDISGPNEGVFLDDVFNLFFKDNYTTPVNNGGSGSGGSGGGSTSNSGSSFFSWYNSILNSGYTFYTGYSQTTTTTGGWHQGAYSNGWLHDFTTTITSTNYHEPTLAQWFGVWESGWNFGGGGSSWGFWPSHSLNKYFTFKSAI
jgi:hypothetical protein